MCEIYMKRLVGKEKTNRETRTQCLFCSEPFLTEAAPSPAVTLAPPSSFRRNHAQHLGIQPRRFELRL